MSNVKLPKKALVLHVTRDRVRIANAVPGPLPTLSDFLTVPLESGIVEDGVILQPEVLLSKLRPVVRRSEYRHARNAILVLSSTQVVSEMAKVPRTAEKRLDRLLQANMDVYFPIKVADHQLTWQVIGPDPEDPDQLRVQLWAVPREMLRAYYALANSCGLSVAAVDYGGHALASAAGISFSAPAGAGGKKSAPARARRAKGAHEAGVVSGPETGNRETVEPAVAVAAPPRGATPPEKSVVYLTMEQEQMMLTFVNAGQVMMQRAMIRSSSNYVEDMEDVLMAAEIFDANYPELYSGIAAVRTCGDLAEEEALSEAISDRLDVPVSVFTANTGARWVLCEGACSTTLDFGDPGMNKVKRGEGLSQAWQYGLVAAGGAAVAAAVVLTLGSQLIWNNNLTERSGRLMTLTAQNAAAQEANRSAEEAYARYETAYGRYSTDWNTIFGRDDSGRAFSNPVLQTYNDNLALALQEIEQILPENVSVTEIAITEQGLILELACPDKEAASYTIITLRNMEYMDLSGITNLYEDGSERAGLWSQIAGMLSESSPALMARIQEALGIMLTEGATAEVGGAGSGGSGEEPTLPATSANEADLAALEAMGFDLAALGLAGENAPSTGANSDLAFQGNALNDSVWKSMYATFTPTGVSRARDDLQYDWLLDVWPTLESRTAAWQSQNPTEPLPGNEVLMRWSADGERFDDLTEYEKDALLIRYAHQATFNYSLTDLLSGNLYLTWATPASPTLAQQRTALRALLEHNPMARERMFTLVGQEVLNPESSLLKAIKTDIAINTADYFSANRETVAKTRQKLIDTLLRQEFGLQAAVELIQSDLYLSEQYGYYLSVELGLFEEQVYTDGAGLPFYPDGTPIVGTLDYNAFFADLLSYSLDNASRTMLTPYYVTLSTPATDEELGALLYRYTQLSGDPYESDVAMDKLVAMMRSYVELNLDRYNHDVDLVAKAAEIKDFMLRKDPGYLNTVPEYSLDYFISSYLQNTDPDAYDMDDATDLLVKVKDIYTYVNLMDPSYFQVVPQSSFCYLVDMYLRQTGGALNMQALMPILQQVKNAILQQQEAAAAAAAAAPRPSSRRRFPRTPAPSSPPR